MTARRRASFDDARAAQLIDDARAAGRDKDLVDAVGIARRHLPSLDLRYVIAALDEICELAEDVGPRQRLDDVLRKARG